MTIENNHDLLKLITDICHTQIIMTNQVNSKRGVAKTMVKTERKEFTDLVRYLFPSLTKDEVSAKVDEIIKEVS